MEDARFAGVYGGHFYYTKSSVAASSGSGTLLRSLFFFLSEHRLSQALSNKTDLQKKKRKKQAKVFVYNRYAFSLLKRLE